ncbi:alpha/beta hydrolase family protein [Sphingorhabdus sp.]|jgi:dipeptidyl aminopeptidase/acylaminoacyl peptidase|uniref:alpha/beta hydrolase family protein n=1 Tax=Sphingorhabdus sp. TaxID=1902408 RepID=UPI0037CB5D8D
MICRFLLAALLLTGSAFAQTPSPVAATTPAAPPSVEAFASLPFVERAELSPDGNHIAGIFGVGGEQKILIMPLMGGTTKAVILGVPDETQPGRIQWVNNDNIIVSLTGLLPIETDRWYITRLLAVNRLSGKFTKLLWDLGGQNTGDVLSVPNDGSNEILVAAQATIYTNMSGFWPTVYRVNVTNGKRRKVVMGREGVLDWGADHLGQVRVGVGYDDSRLTSRLIYRRSNDEALRQIDKADHKRDEALTVPFLYLPGGDNALVLRDNDAGRTSIFEVDLATQQTVKTIFEPEQGEVDGVLTSDDGKLLGASTTNKTSPIFWFDADLANLQANFNKSVPNARVEIESMSADRSKMLVRVASAETPGVLYFYDTNVGVLQKIAPVNEKLGSKKLSPVKLVRYKARDGLEIEAVLTTPKGKDPKNLPFIVMPHGGPWAHDGLYYDYWAQFLASRGYVVMQPNFRGSTGYGTEFLNKGKGQMGFAMQDDITDGVKWAVNQGIADAKRVCIVGASYGGYAAMWGIAKDPDLYRCAISISGVAALRREVNDFGGKLRGNLYKMQWQEMTPDFNAVSPINAIAKIKAPLMLIHGKRDVTVDHVQSQKMFNAMTKADKAVEFVSLPLADHYFTREADRNKLLSSMEAFLAKHNPAS